MPILLVAVWASLFLALAGSQRPLREAALGAFTGVAIAMLTFTEALSAFHALSFTWLSLCWAVLLVLILVLLRHRIRARHSPRAADDCQPGMECD